jgi:uncharacterized phage protein (TIGR01671 family)
MKTETRELKFRVWNGAEMVHDVTVGKFGTFYVNPSNNGLDEKDSASLTPFTTKYHEGTPVMQFTGVKDKNGDEVYEGDVVTFLDACSTSTENGMECDEWENIGEVFWCDSMHRWDVSNRTDIDADEALADIEVIGNIYKNPELLKHLES